MIAVALQNAALALPQKAIEPLVTNPELHEKYMNNLPAVLSRALRYAADCEVIARHQVGLFKVERPESAA